MENFKLRRKFFMNPIRKKMLFWGKVAGLIALCLHRSNTSFCTRLHSLF